MSTIHACSERTSQRLRARESFCASVCVCVCACLCACVRERRQRATRTVPTKGNLKMSRFAMIAPWSGLSYRGPSSVGSGSGRATGRRSGHQGQPGCTNTHTHTHTHSAQRLLVYSTCHAPACEGYAPAAQCRAHVCSQKLTRTVVLELCDEGTAEVAPLAAGIPACDTHTHTHTHTRTHTHTL